jgi:hypothetical protein
MMKAILFMLAFGGAAAYGQDPGMMAAQQAIQASQQAMQMSQQASQQAMQQMQQASQLATQQAMQAAQQANDNAQMYSPRAIRHTCRPAFSVPSGEVAPGTTVSIQCPDRHAAIYFTSGGWTPTLSSTRYTGPIPISANMELQAFAVGSGRVRGPVSRAEYFVQGIQTPVQPVTLSADRVLHAGTSLQLVTDTSVSSNSAKVGDKIGLALDQDVKIGDIIAVPKGTPVIASITQLAHAGRSGTPGILTFEVDSLTVGATELPLLGGETLLGTTHTTAVNATVSKASTQLPSLEAEIKPGMTLTVVVALDTPLKPQI